MKTTEAMTVRREELDKGQVAFRGIVTGRRIPAVHPGEILRRELLEPLGISVYALAKALRVPRSRANDIVCGRRAITADTALRLARYFGTSPEFWVGLQAHYDLETARRRLRARIDREVAPRAAAGGVDGARRLA